MQCKVSSSNGLMLESGVTLHGGFSIASLIDSLALITASRAFTFSTFSLSSMSYGVATLIDSSTIEPVSRASTTSTTSLLISLTLTASALITRGF